MGLKAPNFSGSGTLATLEVDGTTIVVDETNNRVGIGTAEPASTLEIESSSGDLVLEMDNNATGGANFKVENGAGNSRVDLITNALDGGNPASLVNTTITMKAQKVGIMDTSPSYTLDVTGDIRATGSLYLGSTAVSSTATELNLLDAVTRGSILYGNSSGATALLTKGSANQVLTSDGTDISWANASGGGADADDVNLVLHMQVFGR